MYIATKKRRNCTTVIKSGTWHLEEEERKLEQPTKKVSFAEETKLETEEGVKKKKTQHNLSKPVLLKKANKYDEIVRRVEYYEKCNRGNSKILGYYELWLFDQINEIVNKK